MHSVADIVCGCCYRPHGAVVTSVKHDSPNKGSVRVGDRILTIMGTPVKEGQAEAAERLIASAKGEDFAEVECVIARPAHVVCYGCSRLSVCASCHSAGHLAWHAYECKAFQALPSSCKRGDMSTLRMLLRYRMSQVGHGITLAQPPPLHPSACPTWPTFPPPHLPLIVGAGRGRVGPHQGACLPRRISATERNECPTGTTDAVDKSHWSAYRGSKVPHVTGRRPPHQTQPGSVQVKPNLAHPILSQPIPAKPSPDQSSQVQPNLAHPILSQPIPAHPIPSQSIPA